MPRERKHFYLFELVVHGKKHMQLNITQPITPNLHIQMHVLNDWWVGNYVGRSFDYVKIVGTSRGNLVQAPAQSIQINININLKGQPEVLTRWKTCLWF